MVGKKGTVRSRDIRERRGERIGARERESERARERERGMNRGKEREGQRVVGGLGVSAGRYPEWQASTTQSAASNHAGRNRGDRGTGGMRDEMKRRNGDGNNNSGKKEKIGVYTRVRITYNVCVYALRRGESRRFSFVCAILAFTGVVWPVSVNAHGHTQGRKRERERERKVGKTRASSVEYPKDGSRTAYNWR